MRDRVVVSSIRSALSKETEIFCSVRWAMVKGRYMALPKVLSILSKERGEGFGRQHFDGEYCGIEP